MLTVTKRFEISYSHHLPDYDGDCKRDHGHNGIIEVEVKNPPLDYTAYEGMVCDFKNLKERVNTIIGLLDHANINELNFDKSSGLVINDFSFQEMVRHPTAENMVIWIVECLSVIWHHKNIVRVRFYETRDNWAEWKNETYFRR